MAYHPTPAQQSTKITNRLRKKKIIPSIRSGELYKDCFRTIATKTRIWGLPDPRRMQLKHCEKYLERRSEDVAQSTLDIERRALQFMLEAYGKIDPKNPQLIPAIKSKKAKSPKKTTSKIYTREQIDLIKERLTEPYQLLVDIILSCGLSAREFYTILPLAEREAAYHPETPGKHIGLDGVSYTVKGKYGIVREIKVPPAQAERLEALRLRKPITVVDRKVPYRAHYNVKAGKYLSNAFGKASIRALGWTHGVNALRNVYAENRLVEIQKHGFSRDKAKKIVSLEMGHVAPRVTRHVRARKASIHAIQGVA